MTRALACLVAVACGSVGCGSSSSRASVVADAAADVALADVSAPWAPGMDSPDAAAIIASRPYTLHVPTGYDATKPTPLVVMFHGYSSTGTVEEFYFELTAASDAHGFLYAYGE